MVLFRPVKKKHFVDVVVVNILCLEETEAKLPTDRKGGRDGVGWGWGREGGGTVKSTL